MVSFDCPRVIHSLESFLGSILECNFPCMEEKETLNLTSEKVEIYL